jgi:protocatechuate 3,4-dioxygenase beta subunit
MSNRFPFRPVLTRRAALAGVTGCVATLGARSALAQAGRCVLTADSGEGPFYFDAQLVRADVVDGMAGAPLDIAIQVTREDCAPLAGLRVDLWQADGLGLYSGYRNQSGVGGVPVEAAAADRQSLRGTQFADADGWVRFKTIYPSWYGGRTPHIHFKVFRERDELVASQIFFPDEVNAEVFTQWDPYREHVGKRRVFNDTDRFLDLNTDGKLDGVFCDVERNERRGFAARAVVTVGTRA